VQVSALALALLLGFGLGVTFEAGREHGRSEPAEAPASGAAPASVIAAAPAAPTPVAPPVSAPLAEKIAPPVAAETGASAAPASSEPSAPPMVTYAYVYRYEKGDNFAYGTGAGQFENVAAARASVMARCQQKGRNCKFNYAPVGNCIAVARPPYGSFRVSLVEPDEAQASANALSQCSEEHASGCKVDKVLCPQP
jgi:cell division septation protein DedD